MSNPYSSQDVFDIELKQTAIIEEKVKLRATLKDLSLRIQKESAWIHSTLENDYKLKEMVASYQTTTESVNQYKQDTSQKYIHEKQHLRQSLEDEEALELQHAIDKIKLKYKKKYDMIDSMVEKKYVNDKTRMTALETKQKDIETRIQQKKQQLLEGLNTKKSKALVSAETELAIATERLQALDAETDAMNEELQRRQKRRFL